LSASEFHEIQVSNFSTISSYFSWHDVWIRPTHWLIFIVLLCCYIWHSTLTQHPETQPPKSLLLLLNAMCLLADK